MYRYVLVLLLLMPAICFAQRLQTVRGRIIDRDSKSPLFGAIVGLTDFNTPVGSSTDHEGNFSIENVSIGKHTLSINLLGYKSVTLTDVLVISGKETVLEIEMEESVTTMGEVIVSHKREHINDMALVSTKTFDVQETERYAGSRADPARMASNFAGTQGGDDSRNDIIIRGNSPQGVLWRLDGVDIPNPNHFSIPGTTGGPVSMLNSHTLANSDFFMGAFPAEYGDAVAGVFDVKLRNGNNDKYEFTGQLGLLGTELVAEGPISRDYNSSFLVAYRYSTLQLFQGLNIKIGTTSVPNYQDLTFKLNLPINSRSTVTIFGIGGLSNIDLVVSDLSKQNLQQLYGESDRDQYFTSNTGVVGASYSHIFNPDTYTKLTVAETGNDVYALHNFVFRDPVSYAVDSLKPILGYDFITKTTVAHWSFTKKLSSRQTIKVGVINNFYDLNFTDSSRQFPPTRQTWQTRENFSGNTDLVQAYVQYKYRPTEAITFTAGLHGQYLTHNSAQSVEPRFGLKMIITDYDVVTLGYGLHSEMLPLYQYFARDTATGLKLNYDAGFIRSHHVVLGYDKTLGENLIAHLETYYQYLFNVPIETRIGSSYTALDQGTGYSRDFPGQLQNTGTGYNYGLEFTLDKGFSNGFYFLITGSVFDSKAKGNDGIYRNTDYNTHYSMNLLGGYETKLGRNNTLITGAKVTFIGGRLYSPVDTIASNTHGDQVVVDTLRNTLQLAPYFRADLKLAFRINGKKITHEIGLDLVNVFNTKNVLSQTYSYGLSQQTGGKDPFYYTYQLGFLPIFYYKIDFGLR